MRLVASWLAWRRGGGTGSDIHHGGVCLAARFEKKTGLASHTNWY